MAERIRKDRGRILYIEETEKDGWIVRMHGMRKKCYLLFYDKPRINQKALRFQKSLEEVKKLLLAHK